MEHEISNKTKRLLMSLDQSDFGHTPCNEPTPRGTMRILSSLMTLLPGCIFLVVLLNSLGWKSLPSAINRQGILSGLKFQDTSSLLDIDQRVTAPPQFRIQRAEFYDIASIVALRVMVFCPSVSAIADRLLSCHDLPDDDCCFSFKSTISRKENSLTNCAGVTSGERFA